MIKPSNRPMAIRKPNMARVQESRRSPHPLVSAGFYVCGVAIMAIFLFLLFTLPEAIYYFIQETR